MPMRRPNSARLTRVLSVCALCGFLVARITALAQSTPQQAANTATAPASPAQNAAEMSSQESAPTFKVNVKEVVVRVVARDARGHAVGNLTKDDFQIFDKGKPQVITHFAVEQPGAQVVKEEKTSDQPSGTEHAKSPAVAERFIAYVFDDVHIKFPDLVQARQAADRHFATLQPTDRAAIFSTSGQTILDFTDDRTKLHEALLRLQPRPIGSTGTAECPDISYYMADLIVNKNDPIAMQSAIQDDLSCNSPPSGISQQSAISQANAIVSGEARMQLSIGDHESRVSLGVLMDVVRRISFMPGQRSVVLVSPGFITPQLEYEYSDIIDRALHSEVVISALDARGLYVPPTFGDASRPGPSNAYSGALRIQYDNDEAVANSDILAIFADSTGGTFFHNNNDLDEGFKRVAAAPEYFYVLGFSPQNLKLDGSFHSLKVTAKSPPKLSLQARRGYYAPKHLADPIEDAKQDIQDAVFSQEELRDVPLEVHTQFFKASDSEAKLTVLAHMDVRHLRFRKVDGRNGDELTVVSALFDRNGAYIQGNEKILTLRLKDETLAKKLDNGITMKSSFDAKPGSYLVRVVVRDAEGQLSAENGAVEIP